jgi:hypothetical protein
MQTDLKAQITARPTSPSTEVTRNVHVHMHMPDTAAAPAAPLQAFMDTVNAALAEQQKVINEALATFAASVEGIASRPLPVPVAPAKPKAYDIEIPDEAGGSRRIRVTPRR